MSYSPETPNLGRKRRFLVPCDLEIGHVTWPRKIIGHLFYATPSFVLHSLAIGEFKLELQSENSQIGAHFVLTCVTLTFDLWLRPFALTTLLSMESKFYDNKMAQTWWKGYNKRTDGWTDEHLYCISHISITSECHQVKLDAPHSAPTYLWSLLFAVNFLDQ